jgi:nucleoside-diphosphate-sugar epimerase
MKNKLLIIGGSGYIGSEIYKNLRYKFSIKICDNLFYKNKKQKIKYLKKNKNILFQNFNNLQEGFLSKFDFILILAGLVGDPISKKYPTISKNNDIRDMKKLISKIHKSRIKKAIFVSTCSNYGLKKTNKSLKETEVLKPISLYAKAKVNIEKFIFKLKKMQGTPFTVLRFATAYGLSKNRMRFDLTINQFIYEAIKKKKISVYDSDTIRPYCHVKDFSNIIEKVLRAKPQLTNFKIYNCGFDESNYSKQDIINLIYKYLKIKFEVKFKKFSKDRRNYRVDFSKLSQKLKVRSIVNKKQAFKEIEAFIKKTDVSKIKKMGNYKLYL